MLPSPSQLSWYRGHVLRRRSVLVIDAGAESERAVTRALGPAWRVFAVATLDDARRLLGGVQVDVVLADPVLLTAGFAVELAHTPLLAMAGGGEDLRAAVTALVGG
jgi:hypothetical protein